MNTSTKHVIRTIVQTTVGIAAVLPAIVDASGIPASLPWVAVALGISGALTRVMALAAVQKLLPAWLRTDVGQSTPAPPAAAPSPQDGT